MRAILLFILLALTVPLPAESQAGVGDLMVMPNRVVLEGRDRSAEVVLRNVGQAACTYRIHFQELRMLPNGDVEETPKAEGTVTAADLVRFTPRQVELAPGESQVVRIQMRKPEGLPDGEYRSHLVFEGLPPVEPPKPVLQADEEKTLVFDIRTLVAISIPVIVRHGTTSVSLDLTGLAWHPAQGPDSLPSLDLTMVRKGNRSAQGDFKVDWVPDSGSRRTLLPGLGGVIYTNLTERTFHLDLPEAKGLSLAGGVLKTTFTFRDSKQPPVVATLRLP